MKTMKNRLLFILTAAAALTLAAASCGKDEKTAAPDIRLNVSELASTTAVLGISNDGGQPALCKAVSAIAKRTLLKSVPDLGDEQKTAEFVRKEGIIINPPYTAFLRYLVADEDYCSLVVCYDSKGKVLSVDSIDFHTLEPDNNIGQDDQAGSLIDKEL